MTNESRDTWGGPTFANEFATKCQLRCITDAHLDQFLHVVAIETQAHTFRQVMMEHARQWCTIIQRLEDSVVVALGLFAVSVSLNGDFAFPLPVLWVEGYCGRSDQR